ncbi:hypothetical protein NQ314_008528 [Rhamnusium bicolor]|uniref:Uncharacterized protein n=1 Tax=Rhamnusium bicolor TaxID=1586634 RepID=A0AAV8YAP3_9CUCU|nr:hypothetical protein NQ314_008528 [Rhamnusium bicolor]
MGVILHGESCHSHGPGSNKHTHLAKNNINVRAATIHVLGDLLQSIAVLLAAIAIKCNPDAKIADPISTLIFTPIVLCTTFGVGRDSLRIIAERSPRSIANLTIDLQKVAGVKNIHNIHIWSLAPGREAVTVHLAVGKCFMIACLKTGLSMLRRLK